MIAIIKQLKKGLAFCVLASFFLINSLLGASLLLFSALIFTHSGNQVAINIAKQFESRLSIDLEHGSLLRSPQFSNIGWVDGETRVNIQRVDYRFNWACLQQRLCLETLNIEGLQLTLPETAQTTAPDQQPSDPVVINIPIEVIINNINLIDINVNVGKIGVELDKMSLQATAFSNELSLASQITGLLITLPDSEPVSKNTITTASREKTKKLHFKAIPALLTQQMLPNISLPINLTVAPISVNNVQIVQDKQSLFQLDSLETAFTFHETLLKISQFSLNLPETDLQLNAELNFIEDYPLQLNIEGKIKKVKQLQPETLLTDVNYRLSGSGRLSDLNTALTLSNGVNAQLRTNLDLLADNLPHDLALTWQDFQWPLSGEPQVKMVKGYFSSQGSMLDYNIDAQSDYQLVDAPSGQLTLETHGGLQQLQIQRLQVDTLSGILDFSGLLSWGDSINWLGQLQLTDIDLADLNTQYDGHFSGLVKQQATVTLYENGAPDWQFDLPELNIDGELLARPLSVNGRVFGDAKQGLSFDALAINNAQNSVRVDGTLLHKNNLDIAVNIVDISHLVPEIQGSVDGAINIQGPIDALQINSTLSSEALLYEDYHVGKMDLSSAVILTDKPQFTLDLAAHDLLVAEQKIDDLTVIISKPETVASANKDDNLEEVTVDSVVHQVAVAISSELVSTDMQLSVTQTEQQLSAQVNHSKFYNDNYALQLETPFVLTTQQSQLEISPHCWQASTIGLSDTGHLCVKKLNVGESGDVILNIDNYNLAHLNQLLPAQFNIDGMIDANANMQWIKAQQPSFTVDLLSHDMLFKVKQDPTADNFSHYPMQSLDIKLNGRDQQIDVDANIFAKDLLDVQLKGKIQSYQQAPNVNANIMATIPDFAAFLPLLPELEVLEGALTSRLTVTGKLSKPDIVGVVEIKDGAINGAELPMKISALTAIAAIDSSTAKLQASFDSSDTNTLVEKVAATSLLTDTLTILDKSVKTVTERPLISGTLDIFEQSVKKVSSTLIDPLRQKEVIVEQAIDNPGVAYLSGNLDWSEQLHGDIHMYARKLVIYDYGKVDLLISPDIHLLVDEHVKINGELAIDKGKIVVQELPEGAVSQSSDIVVIDIEKENVAEEMPVILDLSVDTGSDLQIVALGLDTFMEGKLSIQKPLNKDLSINGVLELSDGSYRSFGQELVLQDSRIVFQGAPEAPYLQIEAIRDSSKIEDDVTAGVRVTGTPDELELVIFSEPVMAQQETLSYLTRGQGINSSSDSSSMANILIDLAAGQSGGVMSSIGEEVGIKDLSLSTSGTGDEQAVGISGEIAPGVELSYGVGVFDSFSIISLRYELFKRFYIEASSGIYQAVDAYYEWDWD